MSFRIRDLIEGGDVLIWEDSKVTQAFFKRLKEIRDANYHDLQETILTSRSLKDVDLYLLAQLKGQIHTLDMILDLKSFFEQAAEEAEINEIEDNLDV